MSTLMREPDKAAIRKLDGSNYSTWRFKIKIILCEKNLYEHALGKVPRPAPDQLAKLEEWATKNQQAWAIIASSVADSVIPHIIHTENRPDVAWKTLEDT